MRGMCRLVKDEMRSSTEYKQLLDGGATDEEALEGAGCMSLKALALHMTPAYKNRLSSLRYLADLGLRYVTQMRTQRKSHVDSHYVNAVALFLRHFAKEAAEPAGNIENGYNVVFGSCDDKAKVPVGAPGEPQTAVQRRQGRVIAGERESVTALDHDFSCLNLTPSVALFFEPGMASAEEGDGADWTAPGSLYRGKACVCVKDSIMQPSNPWRHMAEMVIMLDKRCELDWVEVLLLDVQALLP